MDFTTALAAPLIILTFEEVVGVVDLYLVIIPLIMEGLAFVETRLLKVPAAEEKAGKYALDGATVENTEAKRLLVPLACPEPEADRDVARLSGLIFPFKTVPKDLG